MSFGSVGSPAGKPPEFDPQKQPPLSEEHKATSGSVTTSRLREKLGHFQSGFSGLPGRIRGHFQSLHRQPPPITTQSITGSAKSYAVDVAPPEDIGKKIQLSIDAEIAAFPYHRSLKKITHAATEAKNRSDIDSEVLPSMKLGQWDTARPLALAAGRAAGLSTKGSEGFIYDKKSGLTAYLLHNPASSPKEVRLVFGGTTSGKSTGGLNKRSLLNGVFTLKQWIANAKNAVLGKTPDSYKQAKILTDKVLQMMDANPRYQGFKLTVSGHSKGGGEAAYAALARDKPLEAICFSSAEMGREMHDSLTSEQKANASRYVTHYNIQGDMIPNVGKVAKNVGHIGKVVTLPAEHTWNNPLDRHDKFTRHIRKFVNS